MQPIEVNDQNFETEVLKSPIPVLVDFWAPWCGPCMMMGPVLEEIAKEMDGKLKIAKLNTDSPENQQLAIQYQIQSIPNIKLFKGGVVVKEIIGFKPKEALMAEIKEFI
jgi:thioredoxin 1